jgi:hypothetical protein
MLTAREAHIQVLQGVQKIAGYEEDMFKAEEIDLQLSRHQRRLAEELTRKSFDDDQASRDILQPLYVKNHRLPMFVPQTSEGIYEENMVYGAIPGNYLHLISNRSKVITSTDNRYCADVSALKVSSLYADVTEKIAVLSIPTPTATAAPYYYKATISLTIAGSPTVVLSVPESLFIKSPKSVFYLQGYILDYFSYAGVDIYYFKYRDTVGLDKFIFVTENPNITAVTLAYLKPDSSPDQSATANFTSTTFRRYTTLTTTNFPGMASAVVDNLDAETHSLYEQNINPFYRSKKSNPKSVIASGKLVAYESKTFIISELIIDYVRHPKNVSLNLSQGLELGGNGPQIVIDRVVEYLKLAIENPSYQAVLNDNQLRN